MLKDWSPGWHYWYKRGLERLPLVKAVTLRPAAVTKSRMFCDLFSLDRHI